MEPTDQLIIHVTEPKVAHKQIAYAYVRASEDWNTKQVTVNGYLTIAPDEHTILEYPVHVWAFGYWNRTNVRKVTSRVKKQLLEECSKLGYTKKEFTQPLEVSLFWERF